MGRIDVQRWIHYVLFICVILEILELEIVAIGVAHHLRDAIVIAIYA